MKKIKKPSDIKIGVIGYGGAYNMGRHHIKEIMLTGAIPCAVAEVDPARRKVATEDFPHIETYSTVEEMLKKSEANIITIITPHNTHADIALKCLRAGRNVVCEKPLAITTAECDAMIAAAKKADVMLSTYHNRHWDGVILNAMKLVNEGQIGDVYRVEAHMGAYGKPGDWWRSSKSISGGILYDFGVHLLEYSLQILNDDFTEVSAYAKKGYWAPQTAWKKDGNEDEVEVMVRFAKGGWLSLNITHLDSNPKRGIMEVTGTKGSMVMDWGFVEVTNIMDGKTTITRYSNPEAQWPKYYQNVVDHLVKGSKLIITSEWSRRPIHILDSAEQSVKKGTAIRTKYH
ncbi:MAG: Gfo/Idh/MocA family oxidoreductase [Verrucomicrobiota bacterium]|nr:Gfo/Idh/MocA family oxidoreductase [Verrucomicrobiota bacterium]